MEEEHAGSGSHSWQKLNSLFLRLSLLKVETEKRRHLAPKLMHFVLGDGFCGGQVVTPDGQLAQYFYGVEFSERDLRLAIVQSSAEKIGSMVDEVLLYCCKYDPNTGRYQALVARLLQIVGAFTILVVGGGLLFFFRLDAKSKTRHV